MKNKLGYLMTKYIRDGKKILNTETGESQIFDSINKAKKESFSMQLLEGKKSYGGKNTPLGNAANNLLAVGDI